MESPEPAARWDLEAEPLLVIGTAEGQEPYLLSGVGDALFLADGGVALLDGGSRQLRLYGPGGVFRAAFGRMGEGPGEFRSLSAPLIREADGGFLLWDAQLRRITRVTPDLRLGETILPEAVDGTRGMLLRARFGDGSLLLSEIRTSPPPTSGTFHDTLHLHRADASGRALNPLVSVANTTGEISVAGGPDPATIVSISILRTPMGRAAVTAAADSLLLSGNSARFEVRAVALDGTLQWIARPALSPRPVGEAERQAFIDRLAETSSSPEAARLAYADVTFPETMPAFDHWVVDEEGNLWMRSYRASFDEGPSDWYVVDREGVWVATATLPGTLRATRITRDHVLGVFQDELGVESVRIYRRSPFTRPP